MKKFLVAISLLFVTGCGATSADQPVQWQQADTSACNAHGKAINFTISVEPHQVDWQTVTCSDGTAWYKPF